jgi:hypothetical protein
MNYNPAAWTFEHDRALTMLKEKSEHELKNFFADIKDMNAFHTWKGGHYNLLFHAVTENNFPAVKALVEFGVSPTLENNKGINVLHLIVKRGQLEMAEVCLRHLKHEAEKISFLNNANGIGELKDIIAVASKEAYIFHAVTSEEVYIFHMPCSLD